MDSYTEAYSLEKQCNYSFSELDPDCDKTITYSTYMNLSYVNVTDEMPISYAVPLYGYVMPFLLVITMVANTLIVVVLSRRHMRTPTNVVLMAMALCDMFTLLVPSPWLIYMYTFGNHYKPLSPISACFMWTVMHEVTAEPEQPFLDWLNYTRKIRSFIEL